MMGGDMVALVIEEKSYEIEQEFVLQDGVILEPVVCGILVRLIIWKNIVAINWPSSGDPRVKLLVNDALLGKLMVKLLLSGDLKLSIHFLALVIVVLVVVISVTSWASHWLIGESIGVFKNESSLLTSELQESFGVHIYLNIII
jgi:hypothetical protein